MKSRSREGRFSDSVVELFRNAKIIGVCAGTEHRYTGVWVVVVDNRVFARSWSEQGTVWFRAFKNQPTATIQFDKIEVPVRGKLVRSARVRDAVTQAFGEKYNTKASKKWVDGFAEPERAANTIEFVPR